MATPIIIDDLKTIEKSYGGSLNNWVVGIMHIHFKKVYNLQYLTMCVSGYMNDPIEP